MLVDSLQDLLPNTFKGDEMRTNCFDHILNLGAKSIINGVQPHVTTSIDVPFQLFDYGAELEQVWENDDETEYNDILDGHHDTKSDDNMVFPTSSAASNNAAFSSEESDVASDVEEQPGNSIAVAQAIDKASNSIKNPSQILI